ncbi:MAG: hypothetical protein IPK76_03075 [Lewinellaceae bacterium]|nr:hypothetical protein [Lewinellaceae bacterium]
MLDVKSSDKGMLVPRMNTGQRTMIVSPATGLLVFDTDTESFWFHDSNGWVELLRGWSLKGNAGTDTTVNFIGTTDNMPLDFRVNNERALRLEYAQNGPGIPAPNIIGGYSGNTVSPGKAGATISGGGLPENPNIVTNNFATIAGGGANTATGDGSTISGGIYHIASGVSSTIGAGTVTMPAAKIPR